MWGSKPVIPLYSLHLRLWHELNKVWARTRCHSCWQRGCHVPRSTGEAPHVGTPPLPPSLCMPKRKEGENFYQCIQGRGFANGICLWISIKNVFTQNIDVKTDCAGLCQMVLLPLSRKMVQSSNPTLWNGAGDHLVIMKTITRGSRGAMWLAAVSTTECISTQSWR